MKYSYTVFSFGNEAMIEVGIDDQSPVYQLPVYRHDYKNPEDMKNSLQKLRDGITSLDELDSNDISRLGVFDPGESYTSKVICENQRIYFDMHSKIPMLAVMEIMISEPTGILFRADDKSWTTSWPDGRRMVWGDVDMYLKLLHASTCQEFSDTLDKMYVEYEKRVSLVFNGDFDLAEESIKDQLAARYSFFFLMSSQEAEVLSRRISGWSNSTVAADLQISKAAASNAFTRAREKYILAPQNIPGLMNDQYRHYLELINNCKK